MAPTGPPSLRHCVALTKRMERKRNGGTYFKFAKT
jgi:hypothetical protein